MKLPRLRRLIALSLGAAAACYLASAVALFALQRQLSFPAPDSEVMMSDKARRVDVPGHTFFRYRDLGPNSLVVVHFHSNGDQVSFVSSLGQEWARVGASFAAVEYPGYPGTTGAPSEASILAAAEAALEHLTGPLGVDRSRIVLSGQSLGTGVAAAMAARGWGTRLLLISPYTSWDAVVGEGFPWLPTRLLVRDRFDTLALAPSIRIPTIVVHGTRDSIVPFAHGEKIAASIPGARLFTVTGGHHHDVLEWGTAQKELLAFVPPAPANP